MAHNTLGNKNDYDKEVYYTVRSSVKFLLFGRVIKKGWRTDHHHTELIRCIFVISINYNKAHIWLK